MAETKSAQKKQSSDMVVHTRRDCQWVDWNEGMCEWYPSNPYPPLKYYIRTFKQARAKQQGSQCEFDPGLGFYLPRNQPVVNQNVKSQLPVNSTNNHRAPVSHFMAPTNVANRLERQSRRHEEKENDFAGSPVIYPFMVTILLEQGLS